MKAVLITAWLSVAVLMCACRHVDALNGEQVWVANMPTQCLNNVWQQEWIKAGGEYSHEREEEILRAFFRKRGAHLVEYREEWIMEAVCAACSCPAGYVARLLINVKDLALFEHYGFVLASESDGLPPDSTVHDIPFEDDPHALEFGDAYTLRADSVLLKAESLQLMIAHGGGCRTHEYTLRLHRIEDTVAYIFLHHNANGDLCKAYYTVRLRADLASFFVRDDWAKLVLLGPNGERIPLL